MNWRVFWAKSYTIVVAVLAVVIVILLAGLPFREGVVTPDKLVQNRILIDVVTDLVTTSIFLIGAIASYFRFFRGRTFFPRLDVSATVDVMPIDGTRNLHVLVLQLENVGSVAIWDIETNVDIIFHADESWQEKNASNWIRTQPLPGHIAPTEMLDSGGSGQVVLQREVPISTWAVTYSIQVGKKRGHLWYRVVTASNRLPAALSGS